MKGALLLTLAGALWLTEPELAFACERCFGAGSDAPAVKAVTASMFALFVVICFVGAGVFSFFNNSHSRAQALLDQITRSVKLNPGRPENHDQGPTDGEHRHHRNAQPDHQTDRQGQRLRGSV